MPGAKHCAILFHIWWCLKIILDFNQPPTQPIFLPILKIYLKKFVFLISLKERHCLCWELLGIGTGGQTQSKRFFFTNSACGVLRWIFQSFLLYLKSKMDLFFGSSHFSSRLGTLIPLNAWKGPKSSNRISVKWRNGELGIFPFPFLTNHDLLSNQYQTCSEMKLVPLGGCGIRAIPKARQNLAAGQGAPQCAWIALPSGSWWVGLRSSSVHGLEPYLSAWMCPFSFL